jgi:hypothetical protein
MFSPGPYPWVSDNALQEPESPASNFVQIRVGAELGRIND